MTAAGLAQKFKHSDVSITLIESEQIGTVGVGEATLPHIRYFNQTLGIHEPAFMKATHATFKLGIEFRDWGKKGDHYIHPFGDFGRPVNSIPFYQYWIRQELASGAGRLSDFSYPIVMAEQGRFRLPDSDHSKIESTFGYAYQFDSSLYAKFLRGYAEDKKVKQIEGRVVDVALDPESRHVQSLKLDNGDTYSAELFIDCSGFRGLLIEQALETGYEDWTKWLPCNRAIAIPTQSTDPILPYTRATALTAGWQWRIPLQHRIGNGHVYCSEFISDEEALSQLNSNLDAAPLADPNQLYFKTGKRRLLWNKNVVSIGLSAGFMEPLESTSIHLIQEGITALLELFPDSQMRQADQDEYNRRMDLQFDRVRDFLLLHYVATQRDDSEMWRYFRALTLPDSLQEKIDAWLSRGYIQAYEFGAFLPPSWVAVMAGQNLMPEGYDPRAQKLKTSALNDMIGGLHEEIRNAVSRTPDHQSAIKAMNAQIAEISEASSP